MTTTQKDPHQAALDAKAAGEAALLQAKVDLLAAEANRAQAIADEKKAHADAAGSVAKRIRESVTRAG